MNFRRGFKVSLVACLWSSAGSLLWGCAAADDAAAHENVGEAQSALSLSRGFWSWGTTNGQTIDIGSAANQTCFLAGVAGNLNAGWGWDHGGRPSQAGVGIDGNGHYFVVASGGLDYGNVVMNNPVDGKVVCIGTSANRKSYSQGGAGQGVNETTTLEPIKANRQCFLSYVSGYSGTWASGSARAQVLQQGANWVLETANLGVSAGIPAFGAVCVDLPANTWSGTGAKGVGNPGSVTVNMLGEATPGACGLTGIQGPIANNSWTDGVLLNWPAKSPGEWTLTVVNGKTGWVTCID